MKYCKRTSEWKYQFLYYAIIKEINLNGDIFSFPFFLILTFYFNRFFNIFFLKCLFMCITGNTFFKNIYLAYMLKKYAMLQDKGRINT